MARSSFRLLPEGEACRVWRQPDGGNWEREYLFTWRPRQYREFEEGSRFHQTSPRSHFTPAASKRFYDAIPLHAYKEQRARIAFLGRSTPRLKNVRPGKGYGHLGMMPCEIEVISLRSVRTLPAVSPPSDTALPPQPYSRG